MELDLPFELIDLPDGILPLFPYIFSVDFCMTDPDDDTGDRPFLAVGVHPEGDRGAGGEGCGKEVVGGGAGIRSTERLRFIGKEGMAAGKEFGPISLGSRPRNDPVVVRSLVNLARLGRHLHVPLGPCSDHRPGILRIVRVAQQMVGSVERYEALRMPGPAVELRSILDTDNRIERGVEDQE